LKKKSSLRHGKLSGCETHFLNKHNVIVYPVSILSSWYIEVNNNGVIKRFEKKVSAAELNVAIEKTIMYYYKLLKTE